MALHGINTMEEATRYLRKVYRPAFNEEFMQPPLEEGSGFVEWIGNNLEDILCEQYDRVVGNDNTVPFEGIKLQIPPDRHRCHYVKANVRVHRYLDQSLAVFHGPRRLANYKANGKLTPEGRRPLRNFKAASGLGIPKNQGVSRNRKSGQSICYKTGQFYLLLTVRGGRAR